MEKSKLRDFFRFEPSEDLSVSDSTFYLIDDEYLHIQVCDGANYGGVTSYLVVRKVQIEHDKFGFEQFGEYKKLSDAMRKVIDLHKEGEG